MNSRKLVSRLAIASALTMGLSACGDSGPSKSEAEAALAELAAPLTQMLGGQQPAKIDLVDIKCSKVADAVFDCQLLANVAGQQIPDRYRFTKLGGKWRASH